MKSSFDSQILHNDCNQSIDNQSICDNHTSSVSQYPNFVTTVQNTASQAPAHSSHYHHLASNNVSVETAQPDHTLPSTTQRHLLPHQVGLPQHLVPQDVIWVEHSAAINNPWISQQYQVSPSKEHFSVSEHKGQQEEERMQKEMCNVEKESLHELSQQIENKGKDGLDQQPENREKTFEEEAQKQSKLCSTQIQDKSDKVPDITYNKTDETTEERCLVHNEDKMAMARSSCGRCLGEILHTDNVLHCCRCARTYHRQCTTMSDENFRKMSLAYRRTWRCCHCKPKRVVPKANNKHCGNSTNNKINVDGMIRRPNISHMQSARWATLQDRKKIYRQPHRYASPKLEGQNRLLNEMNRTKLGLLTQNKSESNPHATGKVATPPLCTKPYISHAKTKANFNVYGYQPSFHTFITQTQLKAREEMQNSIGNEAVPSTALGNTPLLQQTFSTCTPIVNSSVPSAMQRLSIISDGRLQQANVQQLTERKNIKQYSMADISANQAEDLTATFSDKNSNNLKAFETEHCIKQDHVYHTLKKLDEPDKHSLLGLNLISLTPQTDSATSDFSGNDLNRTTQQTVPLTSLDDGTSNLQTANPVALPDIKKESTETEPCIKTITQNCEKVNHASLDLINQPNSYPVNVVKTLPLGANVKVDEKDTSGAVFNLELKVPHTGNNNYSYHHPTAENESSMPHLITNNSGTADYFASSLDLMPVISRPSSAPCTSEEFSIQEENALKRKLKDLKDSQKRSKANETIHTINSPDTSLQPMKCNKISIPSDLPDIPSNSISHPNCHSISDGKNKVFPYITKPDPYLQSGPPSRQTGFFDSFKMFVDAKKDKSNASEKKRKIFNLNSISEDSHSSSSIISALSINSQERRIGRRRKRNRLLLEHDLQESSDDAQHSLSRSPSNSSIYSGSGESSDGAGSSRGKVKRTWLQRHPKHRVRIARNLVAPRLQRSRRGRKPAKRFISSRGDLHTSQRSTTHGYLSSEEKSSSSSGEENTGMNSKHLRQRRARLAATKFKHYSLDEDGSNSGESKCKNDFLYSPSVSQALLRKRMGHRARGRPRMRSGIGRVRRVNSLHRVNYCKISKTDHILPDPPEVEVYCELCSKKLSLRTYIQCRGHCNMKFCNDCCGIADIRRMSRNAKNVWKCRDCRRIKTMDSAQVTDNALMGDSSQGQLKTPMLWLSAPFLNKPRPRGRPPRVSALHRINCSRQFDRDHTNPVDEPYLQDGPCLEAAPKLPKCRECRISAQHKTMKMTNIFCRFYAFRKLCYRTNGTIVIAGFSQPSEATPNDLKLWLPPENDPPADLNVETSNFLLTHVGDQFCDLVEQEKEAKLEHMGEDKTIHWKSVVQGVREMCDVCETTLFNVHWVCRKCGFVVCIDCYKARKNGTVKEEEFSQRSRDEYQWLHCSNHQPHDQSKLMMTQIIASTVLWDVAKTMHEVRKKWNIREYCKCSSKPEEPQEKPPFNGICKQLMSAVTKTFDTKRDPSNDTSTSPMSTRKEQRSFVSKLGQNFRKEENIGSYNLEVGASPLRWLADVALNASGNLHETHGVTSAKNGSFQENQETMTLSTCVGDELLNKGEENNFNFSSLQELVKSDKKTTQSDPLQPAKPLGSALDEIIRYVIEQREQKDEKSEKNKDERQLKHFSRRYPQPRNGHDPLPIRICTLTESRLLFPAVPHLWLCNGKLLLLKDPTHVNNLAIFQEQWKRGQPVLVAGVSSKLDMSLWHPSGFCRDFGDIKNDLVNCKTGAILQDLPMRMFWEGFENFSKRMKDQHGDYMLLKLKDWPPGEDFSEMLPSRFQDLMKVLPLPQYTHRDGVLNLAGRLPECFVRPDLGPKMYNAYGSALYPTKGTTNLHLDISDAVNVMVYVGIPNDGKDEDHIQEALKAIDEGGCDSLMRKRVREEGVKPGALWHIFNARDADKIRDLLNKVAIERGEKLEAHHDPIHDQSWYLDEELRDRLYKEYGVEGYAIAQCLGDSVFIPAGAPHQVRNLHSCIKVAEDFVSPENIAHCFTLTQEFRHLSDTHTNHEDKLQIKNIIYHAVKDALALLQTRLPHRQEDSIEKPETCSPSHSTNPANSINVPDSESALDAVNTMDPINASNPVNNSDPINALDPTNSSKPVNSSDTMNPSNPVNPSDSANPLDSMEVEIATTQ